MNIDIEKIKDLYFNNGYIKVALSEPQIQLTSDQKGMFITITISEGDQYKVSSIELTGNKVFTEDAVRKRITMLPDKPFSRKSYERIFFRFLNCIQRPGML